MITDTISDLHQRGFTSYFILLGNQLFCAKTQRFISSTDFEILEVHSFDDSYSDREQTFVYAIECFAKTIKGVLFHNDDTHYKKEILAKKLRKFWK